MNQFIEQLVAHNPSHPSRNVLDSRFSTSDQVFPLDIEARRYLTAVDALQQRSNSGSKSDETHMGDAKKKSQ